MISTTVDRRSENKTVEVKMSPGQLRLKRLFDILFSGLGLIVSAPVFLLVWVLLRCKGEGSTIFSQERIGRGGCPFMIYKFRTMGEFAETDTPLLAADNDERVHPLGAFLRKHHLDELPQLWNVLKGDMSFVGYRPERRFFIEKIMEADPRYACLYQMRPGVTSEATIYNGYTHTMAEMLERLNMDLRYLETATLWGDIVIILKTLGLITKGD